MYSPSRYSFYLLKLGVSDIWFERSSAAKYERGLVQKYSDRSYTKFRHNNISNIGESCTKNDREESQTDLSTKPYSRSSEEFS